MGYFFGDVCLQMRYMPFGNRSLSTCDGAARGERIGSQPPPNLPRSSGEEKETSVSAAVSPPKIGGDSEGVECLSCSTSTTFCDGIKFDGPAKGPIIVPHPAPLPAGEGTTNLRGRLFGPLAHYRMCSRRSLSVQEYNSCTSESGISEKLLHKRSSILSKSTTSAPAKKFLVPAVGFLEERDSLDQRGLTGAAGPHWSSNGEWTGGGRSSAKENSAERYKGIEPDAMRP